MGYFWRFDVGVGGGVCIDIDLGIGVLVGIIINFGLGNLEVIGSGV